MLTKLDIINDMLAATLKPVNKARAARDVLTP